MCTTAVLLQVEIWITAPPEAAACAYTGVAIGHSVAMVICQLLAWIGVSSLDLTASCCYLLPKVIFGGLVPTVATALYDAPSLPPSAPFLYVPAVAALGLVAHHVRLKDYIHEQEHKQPTQQWGRVGGGSDDRAPLSL